MRAQIQAQIDALNKLADLLHHKCENLIAADVEGIADKLQAAIRPQWVPYTTRSEEHDGDHVFVMNNGVVTIGYYCAMRDCWFNAFTGDLLTAVTAWHEIDYPEPPAN